MTRLMPHFSRGGIHGSSDRLSAVARANLKGASIFCVTHAETGIPLQRDSLPLISLFEKACSCIRQFLMQPLRPDLDVGNLMDWEACETVRIPEHAGPFREPLNDN